MFYKPRCGYGINDIKDNRNNFQQEYNWELQNDHV
jgi:hypothetical protein